MSEVVEISPVKRHLTTEVSEQAPAPTNVSRRLVRAPSLKKEQKNRLITPEAATVRESAVLNNEEAQATAKKSFWGNYYRTSPLLILGIFFYSLLYMLVRHTEPRVFANWLFPDSYLLVQLLLAGANWSVMTYLFQKPAWGTWVAISSASFLFFRFAHFLFTPVLTWSLVVIAAIWWYLLVGRQLDKSAR